MMFYTGRDKPFRNLIRSICRAVVVDVYPVSAVLGPVIQGGLDDVSLVVIPEPAGPLLLFFAIGLFAAKRSRPT